jgi:TonB family protein
MKPFLSSLFLLMVFSSVVFSQPPPPGHRLTGGADRSTKKMKKLAISLLVFLFASAAFSQQLVPKFRYDLRGTVKDNNSTVYPGLNLRFNDGKGDQVIASDINGAFAIDLLPGKYRVTMDGMRSESFVAFIEIQENGLNPNDVEFTFDPTVDVSANWPKILGSAKAGYPPAARAVRATGEVIVAVMIDKQGKVISAKAESGHALLRAAGVQAARQFVFEASEGAEDRNAKIAFVFLDDKTANDGVKRYTHPYRFEVSSNSRIM